MRVESLKATEAVHVEVGRNNGLDGAVQIVLDPCDQFFGAGVLRGCIEDHHLLPVPYDKSVARHIPKIVGLVIGGMYEGVVGDAGDHQLVCPVNAPAIWVEAATGNARGECDEKHKDGRCCRAASHCAQTYIAVGRKEQRASIHFQPLGHLPDPILQLFTGEFLAEAVHDDGEGERRELAGVRQHDAHAGDALQHGM